MVPPSAITIKANNHNERWRFFFGDFGDLGERGVFGGCGPLGVVALVRFLFVDSCRAFNRDIRVGCCSGINYRTSFLASASLPYFQALVVIGLIN